MIITGPLQKALREITPYTKEKLSAHRLKPVDVIMIAKEDQMVDMFGTLHIDETIAILEAMAKQLKEKKRLDRWHVRPDWT